MTPASTLDLRPYDAFDLPDWTGTEPVTWRGETALSSDALVRGSLHAGADLSQPLDLLAIDAAYPQPVADEAVRRRAHQAWNLGEVLLVEMGDRVAIAAPGTRFDANATCELLRRFARAVGASDGNVTVSILI